MTSLLKFFESQALLVLVTCILSSAEKIVRRPITSPEFSPSGPLLSRAVLVGQTLYVSGQLGLNLTTGALVQGGVTAEAEQALNNLGLLLRAAGGNYSSVVKATVFLANISDYTAMNEIYVRYFTHDPPARSAFQVAALPLGGKIEIEVVAVIDEVEENKNVSPTAGALGDPTEATNSAARRDSSATQLALLLFFLIKKFMTAQ
ncbi:putative Ribonuclease [Hypsibius exemplaris]|uniref:Ribonuclease n=1 Tax=Hypsibius exemplaris TaxID=2072580 RepID=A0A1W0W8B9_HYPEX|nr:putative Ribonuclease [Hypsibius exemplaris]